MGKRAKKSTRAPPKEKRVVFHSLKVPSQEKNANIESVGDGVSAVKEKKPCPHLEKGVDLDKLSTKLRSSQPIRCEDCREGVSDRKTSKGKGKHGKKKGSGSHDSKVWVCLECGHYACGGAGLPTASQNHAVRHVRQTRHRMMIQWDNPQLRWCFPCSTLIPVEKTEENSESVDVLSEVVKLIKERSSEGSSPDVEDVWFGSGTVMSETKSEGFASSSLDERGGYVVRGLVNLGNTCFFNSVMQNLLALDRLRDYFLNEDASSGPLTISLKKLYSETKPEAGLKNVINPKAFFGCICSKAPQFRGYQQHDSHELLRCLLDGLYTEELGLRKNFNAKDDAVSSNQDPTLVDAVFGGQISSTLCCVECGHSSTVYEPFLDLSLPVPTKKPPSKKAQPVSRAKKTKLPPKKSGRNRPKVNQDAVLPPDQSITNSSSSSESQSVGRASLPLTEKAVTSSGDSALSGTIIESDKSASVSRNLSAVVESKTEQVVEMQQTRSLADDFTWLDYLEPGKLSHDSDFTFLDNLETETLSADRDMIFNEAATNNGQVSKPDKGPDQEPNNPSENLYQEEIPLQVQDSQILLLPYKEESSITGEIVKEVEASLSTVGCRQEELEFDGFGDLFNEPEVAPEPFIGPALPSEIAETGFMAGNCSDSDPDEVDNTDSPVSVESCLSHLIKPELLSDDNAWDCENCSKILLRQRLEAKKKHATMLKNLVDREKDFSSHVEGKGLSNGSISMVDASDTSSMTLVSHNRKSDFPSDNCVVKVENCQTGELNSIVSKCEGGKCEVKDTNQLEPNSSADFRASDRNSSACAQAVDSCSIEDRCITDRHQQSDSQMTENFQSEDSEDEEINSKSVKVKRNATKRVLINKAPPILTIHLKRFSQDARGRLSKLNGHVSFREIIDLKPYVDQRYVDKAKCLYCLVGVVEHSGTMRGGHYVAYVRGGQKRRGKVETEDGSFRWYHVSDANVRQVSLEEVLRCEAYILFYEKIEME